MKYVILDMEKHVVKKTLHATAEYDGETCLSIKDEVGNCFYPVRYVEGNPTFELELITDELYDQIPDNDTSCKKYIDGTLVDTLRREDELEAKIIEQSQTIDDMFVLISLM